MGESQPGCGDGEPLGCVFDGRVTARVWGTGNHSVPTAHLPSSPPTRPGAELPRFSGNKLIWSFIVINDIAAASRL